jgi:predicted nucleic acid-binding protein
MVLADTTVWIRHFRYGERTLADRLSDGLVLMHPLVSGELACGNLKDRQQSIRLYALPGEAEPTRVLHPSRSEAWGRGWIDAHLSPLRCSNCRFGRDKKLGGGTEWAELNHSRRND